MPQTLAGMFAVRAESVRGYYAISTHPKHSILAQPQGAPAASGSQPVCPHSELIAKMAEIAGVSFNARCFCVQFTDDAISGGHNVSFSACAAVQSKLISLCATDAGRKRVAARYHKVFGTYPWKDGVELRELPKKLDVAFRCPHRFAHSYDSFPGR